MRTTPINLAESIFELFTDPQLSGLPHWQVDPGDAHGLKLTQRWALVQFEWLRRPASGPALRMRRTFDVDCTGYDHLMISLVAPEGAVLRLRVETDAGRREYTSEPFGLLKRECYVALDGARRLGEITLEVEAGGDGTEAGWFNWIGLHNRTLLPRYEAQWRRFDATWELYLEPETFAPSFEPRHGLLVDAGELERIRERHEADRRRLGDTPVLAAAREAERLVPEAMIGEFVNFWNDTRYCRDRDYGKLLLTHGQSAAVAGVVLRDKRLLRLAARYAMSIMMCGRWDSGFICCFPGSPWEHRSFVQSLCMYEVALIVDLAGEYFTPLARDLILRRIAEEGMGSIHFNMWKWDYLFHCNQVPWFTPGRILGCLLLEQSQPRVRPYTELGMQDLDTTVRNTFLPDGGYLEGPMYFLWTARQVGLSLYLHARARGRPLAEVMPPALRAMAAFGEAVASTDDEAPVIHLCDSFYLNPDGLAVVAALLPGSAWVRIYHRAMRQVGGAPDSLFAYQLEPDIPAEGPAPRAFCHLADMGLITSTRRWGDTWVKLLIMGNQAHAGHTHEDKGSFVLEVAGETFAMDPGTCDYSSPMAEVLKHCQRHNMLVPVGGAGRAAPLNPLPADVKPVGRGDEQAFHASVDAAPGWEGIYRRWVRTWDSPTPEELVIRDDYELVAGRGVEFCWQPRQPVEVGDGVVTLRGRRADVEIGVPPGCTVRVDTLPLLNPEYQAVAEQRGEWRCGSMGLGPTQTRLVFARDGARGVIETRVRWRRRE